MTCPDCQGQKEGICHVNYGPDGRGGCRGGWKVMACSRCHGEGTVPDEQAAWIEEGKHIRHLRVHSGKYRNLVDEARRLGIDVVTLSKMERGEIKPYTLAEIEPAPTEPMENVIEIKLVGSAPPDDAELYRLRAVIRAAIEDAREIATHGYDDNPCDHETVNGCRSYITQAAKSLHNTLVEALK